MELGVFIPIGNNGWLISTTSPQYKPTFDLNREVVQRAERFGFDFALSMIKLHGFGGPSQFWDYNLESFTLMAGLAAVTSRIQLFATCAVLTIPPPIAARMAVTIDAISHGNAMRHYHFDPFAHRPREQCTVAALRAESPDVDVVTRVGRAADERDLAEWQRITSARRTATAS